MDSNDTSNTASMLNDDILAEADKSSVDESDNSDVELPRTRGDTPSSTGLKVLFLSSDTGGGHRASAESLARQFEIIFPGSTYDFLDVVAADGVPPYTQLTSWYSHLSKNPAQWNFVYKVSNSRAFEMMADVHLKLSCERATRRRIKSYDPDLVISVHPLMCNVPSLACKNIEKKTGLHLPIYTVVTDLGSAHCLWFANAVDRIYVASDQIAALAKERGKVPNEKIVKIGLPIRHDFPLQAEKLGDRSTEEGRAYQRSVRESLDLSHADRKTVLAMGGGEGCGALSDIVDHLYVEFVKCGIDALILVVCGRNEMLQSEIAERDWDGVLQDHRRSENIGAKSTSALSFNIDGNCIPSGVGLAQVGCIDNSMTQQLRYILNSGALENALDLTLPEKSNCSLGNSTNPNMPNVHSDTSHIPVVSDIRLEDAELLVGGPKENNVARTCENEVKIEQPNDEAPSPNTDGEEAIVPGSVTVQSLGFVTRMAEYMVAADVLVSKAGPGTIAEAASLSLPVMLTSFLPGQEEGNVDFVVDGSFGAFCSDMDPLGISQVVASWLLDDDKLFELSRAAGMKGAPHAAAGIVRSIGGEAMQWRLINKERELKRAEEEVAAAATAVAANSEESTIRRVGCSVGNFIQSVPGMLPSYPSTSSFGKGMII